MPELILPAFRYSMVYLAMLLLLLAAAAWTDIRNNRIPNALVVGGLLTGFVCCLAPGGIGLKAMALGCAAGFVFLLPFYALGVMGAGDVKLMAMAGSFLGMQAVLLAGVTTLAAGGLLAIVYGLKSGLLREALHNVWAFTTGSAIHLASGSLPRLRDLTVTRVRLPYAAAIATGVLVSLTAGRYY